MFRLIDWRAAELPAFIAEFAQLSQCWDGVEPAATPLPSSDSFGASIGKTSSGSVRGAALFHKTVFTTSWRTLHPAREDRKRGIPHTWFEEAKCEVCRACDLPVLDEE